MEKNEFRRGASYLTLSPDKKSLISLGLDTIDNHFIGCENTTPIWRLWLFDQHTKNLNTHPLRLNQKQYWADPWIMGNCSISSLDAEFTSSTWDENNSLLRLDYQHDHAQVTIFFQLNDSSIVWWGEFTNLGPLPVYQFDTIADWQLPYHQDNTFIIPENAMSAIEYQPVHEIEYTLSSTWDGFLLTTPDKYYSISLLSGYKLNSNNWLS